MRYSTGMVKVVTHNGRFHADDVFAIATLQLHLGVENVEVIRTRDEEVIADGDWVADVGGVYDPEHKRFDHHQIGAPIRENGIPYAAFGLVWKHVGGAVAGNQAIADDIERTLVMAIDAADNGVSLVRLTDHNIRPATLSDMVGLFCPARNSGEDQDAAFLEAAAVARRIIECAIGHAAIAVEMRISADQAYAAASDKRLLVFDAPMSRSLMIEYPEVLYLVCPDDPAINTNWIAVAIAKSKDTFEPRKRFPATWSGLRDEELARVSDIPDAVFCHRTGFLFVAGSKEGALTAAQKMLEES